MGSNEDTLLIEGVTPDGKGKEKRVALRKVLKVFALIADLRLFDGPDEIDLTKPSGGETGTGITTEEIFGYALTQSQGTVLNTGNVPLDLTAYSGLSVFRRRLLQPNELDTIPRLSTVVIDTKGTVTVGERLHIASDGRCYFILQ
jgi:hypothetical protein